jgi:hypothetical protein
MTPKQTLIMWCLLGRQGQAMQSEIVPKVEKKDREALVAGGYVAGGKYIRGAIGLKVEDKGWRWAGEHLADELPKNYHVLRQWLTMLQRHLDQGGETLADFIGPAPEWPPAVPAKTRKSKKGRAARPKTSPSSLSATDLRARIERAYLVLTHGQKAQPVPLSKLRAQLADLDRATVDAGLLRILQSDAKARLHQISDPKAISAEEREAAFNPGGEPYHLLWIQS